jgi:hypothetical protein
MKERGIGEYPIEAAGGQIELEKILLPYFTTAVSARHGRKTLRAFEADCNVTAVDERLEVAAGAASKIQDCERRLALDVLQQRVDILADVMAARAVPETVRVAVIVVQRARGNSVQVVWLEFLFRHRRCTHVSEGDHVSRMYLRAAETLDCIRTSLRSTNDLK